MHLHNKVFRHWTLLSLAPVDDLLEHILGLAAVVQIQLVVDGYGAHDVDVVLLEQLGGVLAVVDVLWRKGKITDAQVFLQ